MENLGPNEIEAQVHDTVLYVRVGTRPAITEIVLVKIFSQSLLW